MKSPDKPTLDMWAKMTDENEHGKVRELIAEWLQSTPEWQSYPLCRASDFHLCFTYINRLHRSNGPLPYELGIIRNILTNTMLDVIMSLDKNVCEKVNACL